MPDAELQPAQSGPLTSPLLIGIDVPEDSAGCAVIIMTGQETVWS